jgi:methionyl-tRNA formyltransferase
VRRLLARAKIASPDQTRERILTGPAKRAAVALPNPIALAKPLRVIYLGTSDFAALILRCLADSAHRPLLVIAPPDRPRGRGRGMRPPPVAELARELEIELIQSADVNAEETLQRIRSAKPQVAALCAFGQLIAEPLLSEMPILNVHPSLLPRWRGAAPIERAIMAGDERTGVSIMRLDAGLDSGPIAMQEETVIGPEEDFAALSGKLAGIGGRLLVAALEQSAAGQIEFAEQDQVGVSYAEKITPEERRLDPSRPAAELARVVRALTPHLGAYLELSGGGRLAVLRARPVEVSVRKGDLRAEWGALLLGCGRGALRVEVVQAAGGKSMAADAYLRGHPLPRL